MKKFLILFLLLIFTLSACNQADSNNNSSPANASSPTSSDSNDQNNSSKSKQTGDTVEINYIADDVVKIEFEALPQMNIPSKVIEDRDQINKVIYLLNNIIITDDNKTEFGKMSGLHPTAKLYFKNGETFSFVYASSPYNGGQGGMVIFDEASKYGNRWLAVKNDDTHKKLYKLLSELWLPEEWLVNS